MKNAKRRQIVMCPTCDKAKVAEGGHTFRCCGEMFRIKDHLLNAKRRPGQSSSASGELEIQA